MHSLAGSQSVSVFVILSIVAPHGCGCGEEQPSFYTTQGTAVWTHGNQAITNEVVSDAITVYMEYVADAVDDRDLSRAFSDTAVEFTGNPIDYNGELYAGLQKGRYLQVYWLDGIGTNAFYHEVLHMVREEVLQLDSDHSHSDTAYWRTTRALQAAFLDLG